MGFSDLSEKSIIIYLYKIAILHHGMQSFRVNRLLHACLLHARLLHGCDVTHISSIGRFATSISLREHANERYAARDDKKPHKSDVI